jgi:hypothetical protein
MVAGGHFGGFSEACQTRASFLGVSWKEVVESGAFSAHIQNFTYVLKTEQLLEMFMRSQYGCSWSCDHELWKSAPLQPAEDRPDLLASLSLRGN